MQPESQIKEATRPRPKYTSARYDYRCAATPCGLRNYLSRLHALETLYLEGQLYESEYTGEQYTCDNPPLDLQGCGGLRAISVRNLTPKQVLVPSGCQVKLDTDLGMACLHSPELSKVVTHAVLRMRRCSNAVVRLRYISCFEVSCMTVLHLQGETVGTPAQPFGVDKRWANLEHLFIEAASISVWLGEGLRLRTLELFARTGGLSLRMHGAIDSLRSFHVNGKTPDIERLPLSVLELPFVNRGEIESPGQFPVRHLPGSRSFVFFPEHACSPMEMLGTLECRACLICMQRMGVLHAPPEFKDKREQCFETAMTRDIADLMHMLVASSVTVLGPVS